MSKQYSEGTEVEWDWGQGTATGTVREVFTERVERTFDGTQVVRNASDDDPEYLVRQDDGDEALKSHSELRSK